MLNDICLLGPKVARSFCIPDPHRKRETRQSCIAGGSRPQAPVLEGSSLIFGFTPSGRLQSQRRLLTAAWLSDCLIFSLPVDTTTLLWPRRRGCLGLCSLTVRSASKHADWYRAGKWDNNVHTRGHVIGLEDKVFAISLVDLGATQVFASLLFRSKS